MSNLIQKTAPTEEPVSLAELQAHARIDGGDDDADVTAKILAARVHVEDLTNRALCTSTWQVFFDRWLGAGIGAWPGWGAACDRFRIPLGSLQSSPAPIITYTDDAGTHTVDPSIYEVDYLKGEIVLANGQSWPTGGTLKRVNPICIEFVAGKAAKDVKQTLKAAIMLLAAHFYRNREAVTIGRTTVESMPLKMAVEALIAPDILWRF